MTIEVDSFNIRSSVWFKNCFLGQVCGENKRPSFARKGCWRKQVAEGSPTALHLVWGGRKSYWVSKASGMRAKVSLQLSHYWEYSASFTCKQPGFFPDLKPLHRNAQEHIFFFPLSCHFGVKACNQHSPNLNSIAFWAINPAGSKCMMQMVMNNNSLFGPTVLSNKVY